MEMMAPIRIAINGFGRMDRLVLREAYDWPELTFVHINEIGDVCRMMELALKVGFLNRELAQ